MEYVYVCKDCGKEFQIVGDFLTLYSIKTNCPDCKSFNVQKKFFPVSVHYKGKGFSKKVEEK